MKLKVTNRVTKASATIDFPCATSFEMWALVAQIRVYFIVPTEVVILDK